MTSYRVARRAFLQSIGAAFGLEILLGNLEASAAGAGSPPRLLIAHWPLGTLRHRFVPAGAELSPILQPFGEAGVADDMIALFGLSHAGLSAGGGGGSEAGVVLTMTGASSPGTRVNGGESDDSVAGGPSFDQILLKNSPALSRPGPGYVNVICDAMVDSNETSAQCLSYGYETREIDSHRPGTRLIENVPLMPDTAPTDAYARLFGGFVPGGNPSQAALALRLRKSVLDSALRELGRLRGLAPSSEREKIDAHEDAIRKLEQQIGGQIDVVDGCGLSTALDPELRARTGSRYSYANPAAEAGDDARVAEIGRAHAAVIRAAFQCDLIRVATFQWCSANNQVAFDGLYPADPERAYMHHPLGHRVHTAQLSAEPPPAEDPMRSLYEFLCNVQIWFNRQTAAWVRELKTTTDVFGGNLLDHTVIPFVTEVAETTHSRSPLPALVLGGKALGIRGGQFLQPETPRPLNDMWLAVAQAFFPDQDVLSALANEVFLKTATASTRPLPGIWQQP